MISATPPPATATGTVEVIREQRMSRASQLAHSLANELETRHNIPAQVLIFGGSACVSVFYGLVARTDGSAIWWMVPDVAPEPRKRPLHTLAYFVPSAADRIAQHYATLRGADLGEQLAAGRITLVGAELVAEHINGEASHVAAYPV
ncbi:hypothetical protein GCM10023194_81540 [Planotetraspora phitsanulokensis]|uniref:hypothetical protein n=1 Tax=Planotetraspora phitsanulokensis TaxID=575192 RepID=UPI0019501AB2|nr:hypothetical protein [Planotetraspora phitsanulokensis]